MTFAYPGADLDKIIKFYEIDGVNYHVEYMDGSTNDYVCYDQNEEQRLIETMIYQAIIRQKMTLLFKDFSRETFTAILHSILLGAMAISAFSHSNNITTIFGLMNFVLFASSIKMHKRNYELLKYQYYLEMYLSGYFNDNPEVLNKLEFDKIYQIPLTINTLDKYSYGDIKRVWKKYTKDRKE